MSHARPGRRGHTDAGREPEPSQSAGEDGGGTGAGHPYDGAQARPRPRPREGQVGDGDGGVAGEKPGRGGKLRLPGGAGRPSRTRLSTSSVASRARQVTPAADMMAALLRPCPGMAWKLTSGRPAAMASKDVSPPAFSTSTSQAAINPAMSSVQPSTTAR